MIASSVPPKFDVDAAYDLALGEIERQVPIVIVRSAPGSGKTQFLSYVVALGARSRWRVCVVAGNYGQVIGAIGRVHALFPWVRMAVWVGTSAKAKKQSIALSRFCRVTSSGPEAAKLVSSGYVLFSVTGKLASASLGPLDDECHFDLLVVDEAWQMNRANFDVLSGLADRFVLIGDPGQIPPIVADEGGRWRDDPLGPHRSAPESIVSRDFGEDRVSVVELGKSFRLPDASASVVSSAFYSRSPFVGCNDEDRTLHLDSAPGTHQLDRAIARACVGPAPPFVSIMLPNPTYDGSDRSAIATAVLLVKKLTSGAVSYRMRDVPGFGSDEVEITGKNIAVLVSRNADRRVLRRELAGIPGVIVATADSFQGDQRPVTVVLHPLLNKKDPNVFELDPGRLCVVLSRHQVRCFVILDEGVRGALDCPHSDQYVRYGMVDRRWDGWIAHRRLLDAFVSDPTCVFAVRQKRSLNGSTVSVPPGPPLV